MRAAVTASLITLAFASGAHAQDPQAAMQTYFESDLSAWADNSVLVDAINAQNERTQGYSDAEIDALDKAWRAEVSANASPTIDPVLNNAAADYLRDQVAASGGRITEVFIMDSQGLNVAASQMTSDYWQGDEAKHQLTYRVGAGAVHFGDIEFDESSQRHQGQISFTIVDPASGAPIGAITVGVDATSLM